MKLSIEHTADVFVFTITALLNAIARLYTSVSVSCTKVVRAVAALNSNFIFVGATTNVAEKRTLLYSGLIFKKRASDIAHNDGKVL